MVDVKKEVQEVRENIKDAVRDVDFNKVENDLRVVVDTVEVLNKGNTSSKADNIQRGVNDARKVLDLAVAIWRLVSLFKRKK